MFLSHEEAALCIILCISMFHVLVWRGMDRKAYQSLKITLFCCRVSLPTNTMPEHWLLLHTNLRQDPLDLSFWPFLTFFAPWYRRSMEASSVKTSQKNSKQKLVKCATEVARLCKVSIQSCTQNQSSPKIQSRSGDWISLFYRLDYLYETWHTCSSYSWLQNVASDFLIFALNFERS